jgi:hypothetical protein
LAFSLTITPRIDAVLPIGIHPVFRLPEQSNRATLHFDGDVRAYTYPVAVEPGVSRFVTGARAERLEAIPCLHGGSVDVTRHPLPYRTEEIVLVTGCAGAAILANPDERYWVKLCWDPRAFPSCLMWISNGGRSAYPWSGRFRAIGVEPVAAPFDLGVAVSRNSANPLARDGVPCGVRFQARVDWTTHYEIMVGAT